jgi:hypothetical protein
MNTYYIAGFPITVELWHHGVIGQQKGIRRYQNEDVTLTSLGRKHYGVRFLQKGTSSEEVLAMQKALKAAGYASMLKRYGADGKFGSETLAAVNKFKKDHGLAADGLFDAKTKALLDKEAAKSKATSSTSTASSQTASEVPLDDSSATQQSGTSGSKRKKSSGKKKSSGSGGSKSKSGVDEAIASGSTFLASKISDLGSSKVYELLGGHLLGETDSEVETVRSASLSSSSIVDPIHIREVSIKGKNYLDNVLKITTGGKSKR